jgi:hypothetical protein
LSVILPTAEFQRYVQTTYELLRKPASVDGIYEELDVYFGEKIPNNMEGAYAFSDELGYHYAFTEKGRIRSHRISDDLFDVSYWIFADLIFRMALNYATNHQQPNQDFRRVLFAKETELFGAIGENYLKRAQIAIDETLKDNPFNDNL